ncbi:hypothetical protein JCM10296v2_001213 [Rhodotorula toruloides]
MASNQAGVRSGAHRIIVRLRGSAKLLSSSGASGRHPRLAVDGEAAGAALGIFLGLQDDNANHAFSSSYWSALILLLAHNISDYMTTTTLAPDELLLGLPTLSAVTDVSSAPLLRAIVAVSLQTLVDARWARIRPTNPTQTSPSAATLASRAFATIAVRLE